MQDADAEGRVRVPVRPRPFVGDPMTVRVDVDVPAGVVAWAWAWTLFFKALRSAHRPMPNSIKPTIRSPHDESRSTGSRSRSQSESNPTSTTPAEWPKPHRSPGTQARSGRRTASGAMAAKWSGPDQTCTAPATNPVIAAIMILFLRDAEQIRRRQIQVTNLRHFPRKGKENFRRPKFNRSQSASSATTPPHLV